jgi:hypothetical protein
LERHRLHRQIETEEQCAGEIPSPSPSVELLRDFGPVRSSACGRAGGEGILDKIFSGLTLDIGQ